MKNMQPDIHKDFILSPITDILKDGVSACSGIGSGIETFPLYNYVIQSIFLKLTGFQEQKMKCICWEMASFDFEYRYEFTRSPLGECSSYSEKQKIYKDIINQIEKYGLKFSNINIDKEVILKSIIDDVKDIFENTNLSIWAQKDFTFFPKILKNVKKTHFLNDAKSLFSDIYIKDIYEKHLYKQRNRIAHNTSSYQQNLPTLKALANINYQNENYFVYFSLLTLIDKIFIQLYKKYLETIDNN